MTDRFIERIAELSGQTTRTLNQIAAVAEEAGLAAQAATLRTLANMHQQIALDCLTETQPIEVERYALPERISKSINEIEDLSADLLNRGKPGHSELSEAAALLRHALKDQPQ